MILEEKELKKSVYFGMTLDSSSDISSMENFVLAIKYVNENEDNNLRETFFKLLCIKQKDAQFIYKFLKDENLLKKLKAISSDGESAITSLYCSSFGSWS